MVRQQLSGIEARIISKLKNNELSISEDKVAIV
jgi:hypothetical protein